jgi:glycosyltransferase involved in cell wall biosynthesis
MTGQLLAALRELDICAGHVDTRDPRPVTTIGRLDIRNVTLGLRHAWQLYRILGGSRDAAVHISISQGTWGFLRDAVLVAVVRLRRRPLYIQLHGGNLLEFHRRSSAPMRWLIRKVLGQALQAWALTPTLRSQFQGLVPVERVRCVPNVVHDPLAGASRDLNTASRASGLRVLFLSNLLVEKGCFDLLAALHVLGAESAGWEVRMVGPASSGVDRRLRQKIAALPRDAAQVSLPGALTGDQKIEQYRWADVFVFPSLLPEGQPVVLLEALGAGLPIVAARHPGVVDTMTDEREGLLFKPGDVHALALALARLSREPELRSALAVDARARYETCYQPDRLVGDLALLLASS